MPQTSNTCSMHLGIRLEGNRRIYVPGDTIVGHVYRKVPGVGTSAVIDISLHGRTKSKMTVSNGNSTTTYRGRFTTIDKLQNRQRIYQGPLHIPSGGNGIIWPFQITIPTHVSQRSILAADIPKDNSYLPLDSNSLAHYTPPSTFALEYLGFATNMRAFVEYYLEAGLTISGQGTTSRKEAMLPVEIRRLSPDPPIVDFKPQLHRALRSISSYNLVPGMEDADLTFSQKTKQIFGSSKVPTFYYTTEVSIPTVIQLENPVPLPILIRVVPERQRSTDVVQDIIPNITLTSFSLRINAFTEIKCKGTFNAHHEDAKEKLDLELGSAIFGHGKPISIPCSNKEPPLNLGEMIDLKLGFGLSGGQIRSRSYLSPSFTTYNIRHAHTLDWELKGEIAGKRLDARGSQQVRIIEPSDSRGLGSDEAGMSNPPPPLEDESWIRPPPEKGTG